jgi:hypothetical protein
MRAQRSIPEQVKECIVSGNLEKVMWAAKTANNFKAQNPVTNNLEIIGLGNLLRNLHESNSLSWVQVEKLSKLVFSSEVNIAAVVVIIRNIMKNPEWDFTLPDCSTLGVLALLAIEKENFTDEELITTAAALTKNSWGTSGN